MTLWFDLLGATSSCTVEEEWQGSLTSLNNMNYCDVYPAPLRFSYNISGQGILQMRQEAKDMKGDLRGVMIVRDPLEIVVSAYVYHHRGQEWGTSFEEGMPLMAPEEGVPEMARRMAPTIKKMASAYKAVAPDILIVRYERITNSSEQFDAVIEKMIDFVFKDDITDLQRAEMVTAARSKDLHRTGPDVDHTNDKADENKARGSLQLISTDVYATYVEAREALGYV